MISIFLVGCLRDVPERPQTPPEGAARAETALRNYFQALYEGDYSAAAQLYGGSYQILINYNPDLDGADHTALWERACNANGFQCLRVEEVLAVNRIGPGEYALMVTFLTELRNTFQLGPCCGAEATESPPQSEFEFRVAADESGEYRVLDLPVYGP